MEPEESPKPVNPELPSKVVDRSAAPPAKRLVSLQLAVRGPAEGLCGDGIDQFRFGDESRGGRRGGTTPHRTRYDSQT